MNIKVDGWDVLIFTVFSAGYMAINMWYARREKRDTAKLRAWLEEWTNPCPHCLGTGRIPKEGCAFSEKSIADFKKRHADDQIPEPFKRAFKDRKDGKID